MKWKLIIIATALIISCLFGNKVFSQILKYDTQISINSGKKLIEKLIVTVINNKTQTYLSEVAVAHSPEQTFELLYARILDSNGKEIRKLKKKEISTRNYVSQGTFFEDNLVEEFSLYATNYPYQFEYSYTLSEDEFVYVDKWYPLVHGAQVGSI